jgi:dihydrolipoamide dehydrogenase
MSNSFFIILHFKKSDFLYLKNYNILLMFDVIVVGGGPGGYVAAIRASQLGLKTAIIERESLGGVCLNWGCIPTKALLKTADILHTIKRAEEFGIIGINQSKIGVDFEAVIKRSRTVAATLSKGISSLMKKNNIEVIFGEAKFISQNEISVKDQKIKAKHIIIATGARAKILPGYEPDGDKVWAYREAMTPKVMPKSLIIVGSGAIGVEFASFYSALGVKVTLIEAFDRILPYEDLEIANMAKKEFEKQKIEILTGVILHKLHKDKAGVVLDCTVGGVKGSMRADNILMAVGVVPNTENLGLDIAKVGMDDKKQIIIDKFCKTNIANVYAIGDVANSQPRLAHKSSHEGIIVAEYIASLEGKYDIKKVHSLIAKNVPGCTYSHPQIASVGINEEQAKKDNLNYKVGKFPLMANGKSIAAGEPFGMVKTIFDAKTGELLGAHLIGHEVTELIGGITLGKQAELVEQDFMQTVFPHPTVSESIHESVLNAFGIGIHF